MYHGDDSRPQDQAADAAMTDLYQQLDDHDLPADTPFNTAAGHRDLTDRIQAEFSRGPQVAEHLAEHHAGHYDVGTERISFLTWLDAHTEGHLAARREAGQIAEADREEVERAREQAVKILQDARDQARRIVSKARDDAEQIVTDARHRQTHQAGSGPVFGVLYIYSASPALCPHIEWAVNGIVGAPVNFPWLGQPASPGSLCAKLTWQGRPGTAAAIASALAGWHRLRFEVTEDSSPGCDSVRYCYTPDLGIFTAVTAANGDLVVPESRLRAAVRMASRTGIASLEGELDRLLGTAWDNELEPFRRDAETAQVPFPGADVAG